MGVAAGSLYIAAGETGPYLVSGLPINPRRIAFKAMSTMSLTGECEGLTTRDVPPIAPNPFNQSVLFRNISGGVLIKSGIFDAAVALYELNPPSRLFLALVTSMTDNSFTLFVNTNSLTSETIVQWMASS